MVGAQLVAVVRNATRHRDDVILLYGSKRWQARRTDGVAS